MRTSQAETPFYIVSRYIVPRKDRAGGLTKYLAIQVEGISFRPLLKIRDDSSGPCTCAGLSRGTILFADRNVGGRQQAGIGCNHRALVTLSTVANGSLEKTIEKAQQFHLAIDFERTL